ncbi:MAG: DNA adenine methylase [Cyanobacteria bacterium P01_D01_bin.44]
MTSLPSTLTLPAPRPFLKWAGGKARLIPQYLPHLPQRFDTYHEPFLGGGALFFHLAPQLKSAYLSDLNPELVNVYKCVRDCLEDVLACLEEHQRRHCQQHYYSVRAQRDLCPIQRAARLIYLNKTCYNGLYRENQQGHFNVPMGRYKNPKICNPELLAATSRALQIAEIEQRTFEAAATLAKGADDFVYFDPPYHPISDTSSFTAYSRFSFKATDQERLRVTFTQLAERGVSVLLSNSDCEFVRNLYEGFTIHPITAARAINSNARKRGKIGEVLVSS